MADSFAQPRRRPAAVVRRIALARLALLCEDLMGRLWRALAVLALALGLSLMGIWLVLPGIIHVGLLAILAVVVGALLWRDLKGLSWPDEAVALRRLELKSGFDHRPLLAVEDSFAGDRRDASSVALFEAHRRRMAARIRAIRIGRPLSPVSGLDRFALRAIALLVLAIGLIVGAGDARSSLLAALHPDFSRGLSGPGAAGQITLWITPPAYTGVPPIWLDPATAAAVTEPVAVPVGSELVVQARGGDGVPEVVVDDTETAFAPAGPGSYQLNYVIKSGSRFAIDQAGQELAAWPIRVIPDNPPAIALDNPPKETLRTGLRLDVTASDDYGLQTITGTIRRVDKPDDAPLEISVPLAHAGVTQMQGPAFYNFTAHPWAGMDVTLQLTATDVVGQTTTTDPVTLTLPERYFYQPVARRIAELRKSLITDPESAPDVAQGLMELTTQPDAYLGDVTVHLALNAAAGQLTYDDSDAGRAAVVDLMWDTAIAVEEGPFALAEQRVQDIQKQIADALANGASDQEIDKLLADLRAAMEDYMKALSNRLRTDPGDMFDPTDALKAVGSKELTNLVDQIRQLIQQGARDEAQTLLTRLQEIMQNIQVGNLSDLTGAMTAEAAEVLHTIRQLMTGQQDLLDKTFQMLRELGRRPDRQPEGVRDPGPVARLPAGADRAHEAVRLRSLARLQPGRPLDGARGAPARREPAGPGGRPRDRCDRPAPRRCRRADAAAHRAVGPARRGQEERLLRRRARSHGAQHQRRRQRRYRQSQPARQGRPDPRARNPRRALQARQRTEPPDGRTPVPATPAAPLLTDPMTATPRDPRGDRRRPGDDHRDLCRARPARHRLLRDRAARRGRDAPALACHRRGKAALCRRRARRWGRGLCLCRALQAAPGLSLHGGELGLCRAGLPPAGCRSRAARPRDCAVP